MFILYIGSFRLPNYDAAAARVLNNANLFRLAGNQVSFISWGGKYRDTDLCDDGIYKVSGFKYCITDELTGRGSFLQRYFESKNRGRKTMEILLSNRIKPDLIITYNAGKSFTELMSSFCCTNNIKYANDITEWYDNNELHINGILSNYLNMTKTQLLVKNKIVISSYLNNYYCESNNLLLPPLCDPYDEKWAMSIDDERVKSFDGITLIYAGNPAKKDSVHTVINAVNTLANEGKKIRFLILGVTREGYLNKYSKMLAVNNLHKNILFLGRVSQDLIPAYYKKADFMVLLREPTRKNMAGFPTKFAESMTAGVPVIANATSDLDQYIKNGENGFLVPGFGYEYILSTLRNEVLSLSSSRIEQMKEQTKRMNGAFDYRSHKNAVEQFLKNLK